jgi:hypothetical protein
MPSSFGSGLIEGVIGGWQKQSEKQDQLKRQDKQQQIENNLHIINAQDLPDDVKQNAAQQLQDLMQGKKPGAKGGGQLSPVLGNLMKLIKKSHGDGGSQPAGQGGLTENTPNGQAAPGTAGSTPGAGFPGSSQPAGGSPPPLPQGANGRPTLQGSLSDAPPSTAPAPGGTTEPEPKQSTLDAQIEATQRAIAGTQNPITKQKLVDRLGQLTDLKIKNEQEVAKEERTETGREALEKLKKDAASDLQKLKDESAEKIAAAKLEGAKEEHEARLKAEKELAEFKEGLQEKLKKVAPGRNTGSGGDSKAQTRRGQQIEDKKNAELRKAEEDFARAKTKADQLPPGQAKGAALRDAMDALNTAKAQAQAEYLNAVKQNAKSVSYIDGGKTYTIPRDKEKEFLKDHPQAQAA